MNKKKLAFVIGALAFLLLFCGGTGYLAFFRSGGGEQQAARTPVVETGKSTVLNPTGVSIVFSQAREGQWSLFTMDPGSSEPVEKQISWGAPNLVRVQGPFATALGKDYGLMGRVGRAAVNWINGDRLLAVNNVQTDWAAVASQGRAAFVQKGEGFDVLYIPPSFSKKAYEIMTPAFSPDGEKIAVAIRNDGYEPLTIVLYRRGYAGEEAAILGGTPGDQAFPSFSPSGNYIAFAGTGPNGRWGLWLTQADASGFAPEPPELIVEGGGDIGDVLYPSWGPEGWITFTGCPTGPDEDWLCSDGRIYLLKLPDDPAEAATVEPVASGCCSSWLWPWALQVAEVMESAAPPEEEASPPSSTQTSPPSTPTKVPGDGDVVVVDWPCGLGLNFHKTPAVEPKVWVSANNILYHLPDGAELKILSSVGRYKTWWRNPTKPGDQRIYDIYEVRYCPDGGPECLEGWVRANATHPAGETVQVNRAACPGSDPESSLPEAYGQ